MESDPDVTLVAAAPPKLNTLHHQRGRHHGTNSYDQQHVVDSVVLLGEELALQMQHEEEKCKVELGEFRHDAKAIIDAFVTYHQDELQEVWQHQVGKVNAERQKALRKVQTKIEACGTIPDVASKCRQVENKHLRVVTQLMNLSISPFVVTPFAESIPLV